MCTYINHLVHVFPTATFSSGSGNSTSDKQVMGRAWLDDASGSLILELMIMNTSMGLSKALKLETVKVPGCRVANLWLVSTALPCVPNYLPSPQRQGHCDPSEWRPLKPSYLVLILSCYVLVVLILTSHIRGFSKRGIISLSFWDVNRIWQGLSTMEIFIIIVLPDSLCNWGRNYCLDLHTSSFSNKFLKTLRKCLHV